MKLDVKLRIGLIVALAAVLVVSAAIAAGLGPAGSSARKPKLAVASGAPLVVVGQGFRSAERVAVTVSVGGSSVSRALTASGRGRFTARFPTGFACGPISVAAVGRQGSRAVLRSREIPPPCGIDPAPTVD
ncbi:MAG TPA: hypothetical protein VGW30_00690 [Gaiellaceae bacterium]|nr:hypothetical protein [Gaiellaceae bacterium]